MNEPVLVNVRVKILPGAMLPEFQAPPSAVDVCGTESVLVHATVAPAVTVIGLGVYAVLVRVEAPAPIVMAVAQIGRAHV